MMSLAKKLGEQLAPLLKDVPPEQMAEMLGSALDEVLPEAIQGAINLAFEKVLPEAIQSKIEEALPGAIDLVFEKARPDVAKQVRSWVEQSLEELGYSDEVSGLVRLLAAKSNDSKEEVLRKALTLYGLALDAQEKGNRMAILRPDDEIVHDVIGIGHNEGSPQPVAS
jgi:hypothetical protein